MNFKFILLSLFGLIDFTSSTILSDIGCSCALTKSGTTTPSAGGSINVGCSAKNDWNSAVTTWCLTDQTNGQCGTLQPSFGWVDYCGSASINGTVSKPNYIEWDQTGYTFYTGQNININWTSQNIKNDEWLKITYIGSNTRTLTTGSGVNVTAGTYTVRLSDSTNGIASNVPITISTTNPTVTDNTNELITVIQSKLMNINVYDNITILTTLSTIPCDDRNLTVVWRGLGQSQFGTATVSIRSGFGTLVGSSVVVPANGNVTLNYLLPRSFTPNGGSTYTAQIIVQDSVPGSNAYTGSSIGFKLSIAPSTSPTPTNTPTPSKTPSITPSATPTISETPSITPSTTSSNTPTPSRTSSITPSPSTTETARPSLDIEAISRLAASNVDIAGPVIGAVVGTLLLILIGGYLVYQQRKLKEKRLRRLKAGSRMLQERNTLYGVTDNEEKEVHEPKIVMYQINMPGNANKLSKKK